MLPITPTFLNRTVCPAGEPTKTETPAAQIATLTRQPSMPGLLQGLTCISIDRSGSHGGLARTASRTGSDGNLCSLGRPSNLAKPDASFSAAPVNNVHEALDVSCLPDARAALEAQFGAALVQSRLQHDVFADLAALKRQLTHETKTEMTLDDYRRIEPFGGPGAQGVPEGWHIQDRITCEPDGLTKVRSTLAGPNGESGMIVRSFDGGTLYLNKAYKSTLPTRLTGVPGFERSVATINYLTARACRILGVTPENLQHIKVNRLQHREALAHLDWLRRKFPDASMAELVKHTTWARSYIRETAEIVGHAVKAVPVIDLEGDANWVKAHPGAAHRDWQYMGHETERLTIKHLTGQKLPRVDDPTTDWRAAATRAVAHFKAHRCAGLEGADAAAMAARFDSLLTRRLAAIKQEEISLRARYELPQEYAPRHVNFDVTFRTAPHGAEAA